MGRRRGGGRLLAALAALVVGATSAVVLPPTAPAGAATTKPLLEGLLGRDGAISGLGDVVRSYALRLHWADLQPAAGGALRTDDLDDALGTAADRGARVKLRVFAGHYSPEWAKELGGAPVAVVDPFDGKPGTIPRFWTAAFGDAYAELQERLAARYDDDPRVAEVVVSRCTAFYPEPFLRGTSVVANRHALLDAGYTAAADQACHRGQIEAHEVWATTPSGLAFNPQQVVLPGGGATVDEAFTVDMMRYCRSRLGDRCVLENLSIRTPIESLDPNPAQPRYQRMYAAMADLGGPLSFQTAVEARIGDCAATLAWAAEMGASSVELPRDPLAAGCTRAQLVVADALLRAGPAEPPTTTTTTVRPSTTTTTTLRPSTTTTTTVRPTTTTTTTTVRPTTTTVRPTTTTVRPSTTTTTTVRPTATTVRPTTTTVRPTTPTTVNTTTTAPESSVGIDVAEEGARFVPAEPTRLLDTRLDETGRPAGPVPSDGVVEAVVAGRAGVPDDAAAVVVTLTATDASGAGYVTAWPAGQPRPLASNLNVERAGQTIAATAVVRVGARGAISLYAQTGTHLLVDVTGSWRPSGPSASGRFVATTPARLLDTRLGGAGAVPDGATVVVPVAGHGGLPAAGVRAVALNLTATDTTGPGYLAVWPDGPRPLVSALNVEGAGQTIANAVVVPVGADGSVRVHLQRSSHVVVDVTGWFTDTSAPVSGQGLLVASSPHRLLDTRTTEAVDGVYAAALVGGARAEVAVPGRGVVPATGAAAVVATVTATGARGPGFVTVSPGGGPPPGTSTLNVTAVGQTIANLAITPLGVHGHLALDAQVDVDLVLDVTGWFTGP